MTKPESPTRGPRRLFDLDAEQRIIACAMLKPDALDEILLVIRERDLSDTACRQALAYLVEKREAGQPFDSVLLPKMRELFGAADLGRMTKLVPSVENARYYAAQVRELSRLRDAAEAAEQTLEEVYGGELDADRVIGNGCQRFADAAEDSLTREPTIAEVYDDTMRRLRSEDAEWSLLTGLSLLDAYLDGLRRGQLVIVAARTSMGKSALALTIASNVAFDVGGGGILYFSFEMPRDELMRRLLAMRCNIPLSAINARDINAREMTRLEDFGQRLDGCPLHINDEPDMRVSQIAAYCRRHQRRHGLDLVVVDYLQQIEADDERESRERQVARMTRQLKLLARQLKVPVVCCAQLNRESENTKDRRPKLHHLRESGAVEQDADIVLLIHRENPESDAGEAEILVAKNRNGKRGTATVAWVGMYTRFDNLAPERFKEFDDYNAARGDFAE